VKFDILISMANSTLIVYEPVENFGDKSDYWFSYIDFYEKYWGGPTSPFGVWFGNEYETFRKAMSSNLDVLEEEIEDCFFMKDENGKYYIAPLRDESQSHIFFSENIIPLHWFVMFREDERKILYTHWGFNAISYDSKLDSALRRLQEGEKVIESVIDNNELSSQILNKLADVRAGMRELYSLLSGFDPSGCVVLNYGEICSFIHPYTIRNENSAKDMGDLLALLSSGKIEDADSLLNMLAQKWDDIRRKASGDPGGTTIQ
jgi:hypothetical protein